MSSDIWMRCGGKKHLKRFQATLFRTVENQTHIPDLRLLDDPEDFEILEEILEESKPKIPKGCRTEEKLIYTPLRYKTLKFGTRFAYPFDPNIWYGASQIITTLYERAYNQFVLREHSPDSLGKGEQYPSWTSMKAKFIASKGVDLTKKPFDKFRSIISSKTSYSESQKLGKCMREDGVTGFKFFSARTPVEGINVGIMDSNCYIEESLETSCYWTVRVNEESVTTMPFESDSKYKGLIIPRDCFLVNGKFPLI